MNVGLVLAGIGALEYQFTYQPLSFPPWGLTFRVGSSSIEVSAPTLEGVVESARKQVSMNREQYLIEIQAILDQFQTGLTAIPKHDSEGVAIISVEDTEIGATLIEIEYERTDIGEATDAVHNALSSWGL